MKKINYFLLLLAMMSSLSALQAKKVVVNTAATLQTAFNGAQDKDTILLKPGLYDTANKLVIPATGLVVIKSYYDNNKDSIAVIRMEVQSQVIEDITYPKKPSLIFDNLSLKGRYDSFTTSSYMITFNTKYQSMDTLAFRNCEISGCARSMIRGGAMTTPTVRTSNGDMEWFEMSNCKVHDFNGDNSHSWPIVYSAHVPMYVYFRNNTFYDIPYNKSIFELTKMTVESARSSEIYFENNTVVTTYSKLDGVISTGSYLSAEAKYVINNNMFILPNYADAQNLKKDTSLYSVPAILKCKGGIITANNNMVDSMKYWLAGQTLDVDGQGGFLVIDTLNTYRMRDLNFSWNDFADAQGNDFSYLSTKLPATSGIGGKPIGDPRWVKTFTTPRTLTAIANNTKALITPHRAYYENGSTATVKASIVDGYIFKGWKNTEGTLISTDNPYSFVIATDVNLVADYILLQPRTVTITVSGSTSASYTIAPTKAIYYEGDEITLTLNKHFINDFTGWSDGNTDLVRKITITGNIALTANFTEHPYILAWDFHQLTTNNSTFAKLESNHAKNALNKGYMLYMSADTLAKIETRNNKFTTLGKELYNCLTRKTPIENKTKPSYIYIKFSTKGLTNLKVKSIYATDNSFFKVQKMEYSANGSAYTTFATDTISGNIDQIWRPFAGKLPVAAENQDSVAVRWVSDPNTEQLFVTGTTAYALEQIYISNIIVIDNNFTAVNHLNADNGCKIYSVADKLMVNAETNGKAEVYSVMGLKVKELVLSPGLNETSGLHSGIYIVRVGSQVQKVLIK